VSWSRAGRLERPGPFACAASAGGQHLDGRRDLPVGRGHSYSSDSRPSRRQLRPGRGGPADRRAAGEPGASGPRVGCHVVRLVLGLRRHQPPQRVEDHEVRSEVPDQRLEPHPVFFARSRKVRPRSRSVRIAESGFGPRRAGLSCGRSGPAARPSEASPSPFSVRWPQARRKGPLRRPAGFGHDDRNTPRSRTGAGGLAISSVTGSVRLPSL
jgi:hypothetical protein